MINLKNALLKLITIYSFLLLSCSPAYRSFNAEYEQIYSSARLVPDYSDMRYWASHPWKKDPADSLPKPLQNETIDSSVDVFFVHPTTLTSKETKGKIWNADINDAELNAKTDYTTILYQASVFNKNCRIFAPRYRQAHIFSFFSKDSVSSKAALELAYEDVKAAFDYYLKNYNRGRPIIIAGHSQGTFHSERLLKEYFENNPLQNQLVCAYIIGMIVPRNYFSVLKPCADSSATGCFVTWRTFKNGFVEDYVKKENGSSWVVNPLSWTMDSLPVSRKENKGAILSNFQKLYPHSNSARITNGVIWTNRPRFPFSFLLLLRKRNYHVGDINLFYMNMRENIQLRINRFLVQNPK